MVHKIRVRAFVDGKEIYDSNSSFLVTTYAEPHLAARYGVVVYEYVRILTNHSLPNS